MHILVVRNDKLGDFITALPAIYVLKQHDVDNRISVLVAPINVSLASACDFIDEVLIDEGESAITLAKKLADKNFDFSLTLFSNTRVAFAQFVARIPQRIAPATKLAQVFYTSRVRQRRSEVKMAEFEYNLALTQAVFPEISLHYPQELLHFQDAKDVYKSFCKEHDIVKELVCFHVGFGGSSDANLDLDSYEHLIRKVLEEDRYQVMMSFGPDETVLYESMQKRLEDCSVVYYLSLDGLVHFAKILSGMKLFVSTSTGTYHLASLVGTQTMTFFADSLFASAKRWKSVGDISKQNHYMLPLDIQKKESMLQEIEKDLLSF